MIISLKILDFPTRLYRMYACFGDSENAVNENRAKIGPTSRATLLLSSKIDFEVDYFFFVSFFSEGRYQLTVVSVLR